LTFATHLLSPGAEGDPRLPRVFLSHATSDRDFVENEIVPLLNRHGIETWYSQTDIGAASNWERMIRTALDTCDWFLVAMSSRSLESEWVRAEVSWAMEERRGKIVPVLLDGVDPNRFHLMMREIQFVDFSGDLPKARKQLLAVWNIEQGESFSDRFEELRLIGKGGMGEVWLARDRSLDREVAIKRIRKELIGRPEAESRFFQEARDAAGLNHPNIVPILNTDRDDRGPFLVLEYMEGGSLREWLVQGKIDPVEALALLRQLLMALEHAHEKGILHRDIKPGNILLTRSGIPKLGDFGLAWALDEEATREAAAPQEGTRSYLAPELVQGDRPSVRTDLYSLGVTFYEMLTGRDPDPIHERKVPSTLQPFLRKLTSERPAVRYTSAASALQACRELERAMELAGRTDQETAERISRTVAQGYEHCASATLVDAQACFERVLAEEPRSIPGGTGLLLVHLIRGDMEKSAPLHARLSARNHADPVLDALRGFFDSIETPVHLRDSPAAMPFSYELESARRGRLTKDLVEWSKQTLNLGDVGELLVELAEKKRGEVRLEQSDPAAGRHRFRFVLGEVTVDATYVARVQRGGLFRPARLLETRLEMEVSGTPFEIYRLVRYLTRNLEQRFKRDPGQENEEWRRLDCDFKAIAVDAASG